MAASAADGGVESLRSDASSVISLAKGLMTKMKAAAEGGDQEATQTITRECAASAPAMISAMKAHSDNGDVQRVAALILMCGLDELGAVQEGDDPVKMKKSLLADAAPAVVKALAMSLTCSFAMPIEEFNAGSNMPIEDQMSGSNREFESFLLAILLEFYEWDEGLTLIEVGVLPALVSAINFDGDSKVTGREKKTLKECKGRELDLLQCLLRSQPTCLKSAVEAGACGAVIAAMHTHGSDHIVCASGNDVLQELLKDEASQEAVEAALSDPALQEALKLGQLSPLALIQQQVRAGLQANREAELVEKAKKLGLTPVPPS